MNKPGKTVQRWLLALTALVVVMVVHPTEAAAISTEKEIYQFLTDTMEFTPAAACGVMSNIYYESGFRVNIYGMGNAYGLCQWTGPRYSRLRSWCSSHGYSYASVSGQMHFMQYELNNYYPSVLRYLKNVSNTGAGAYNAAHYWCCHFEIPANTYSTAAFRAGRAQSSFWPTYGSASTYASAAAAGEGIRISWNSTSKYGYRVRRAETAAGTYTTVGKIAAGAKTSFTDTGVEPGKTYYYYIQTLNKQGEASARSNKKSCEAKYSLQSENCKITLEKTSYVYNGKAKKPSITIKYGSKTLRLSKDYTVTYRNNRDAGTALVKLSGQGKYTGTVSRKFTIQKAPQRITASDLKIVLGSSVSINAKAQGKLSYSIADKKIAQVSNARVSGKAVGSTEIIITAKAVKNYAAAKKTIQLAVKPKQREITSIFSPKKGSITVKWKSGGTVTGYQIQYSPRARIPDEAKIQMITDKKVGSVTLTGLTGGKTWYVRIRPFQTIKGNNFYGYWSKIKSIRVKK